MISLENKQKILKNKLRKYLAIIFPWFIFFACLITSYFLKLQYSESTNLFNDKLIDVSSIFFGIFVGCIFLFEKFSSNKIYRKFLKFCKTLLYFNITIICLSFIIILINEKLPEELDLSFTVIYPRILIFSIYIALFAVTLLKITQFSKMIFTILKR